MLILTKINLKKCVDYEKIINVIVGYPNDIFLTS
jgi:hypothetical protein